jgi:hypothetical protein
MLNAGDNDSENTSTLRDKRLCSISEMIRNGERLSVVAREVAQVRVESGARVSRAHDVVAGIRQGDRFTKEQRRAEAFALDGEEQLQRLMLPPLDELSALLDLRAAIVADAAGFRQYPKRTRIRSWTR